MADHTPTHVEPVNHDKPTQGIAMGYLALGLAIFAILAAVLGVVLGMQG